MKINKKLDDKDQETKRVKLTKRTLVVRPCPLFIEACAIDKRRKNKGEKSQKLDQKQ